METSQPPQECSLSMAPCPGLRLRELRRQLLLRVAHIKHPIFSEMNKSATMLSEREIEVLNLISFGHSNQEIAGKLHLSIHTVNNHRKNMLARSRCTNTAELVRLAIMEHVI
jgi:DNA-binding CsgD family transcriptional regulator